MDVIRKLGPVELTKALRLVPVRGGQAQGPRGHVRGLGLQPLRALAVQPVLQVLHREGVGGIDVGDPLGVGGPADQGPVVLRRRQGTRSSANRGNKIKSLISEFNYPRYGPGQMWERMTDEIRAARRRGAAERTGDASADGRAARGRGRRGRRDDYAFVRDLLAAAANDGRHRRAGGARRGPRRGSRPALPRLPDRRARDRRRGPVPRQLDLHPRSGRPRGAHPELPLLESVDGAQQD